MDVQEAKTFFDTENQIKAHVRLLHLMAHLKGHSSENERLFFERVVSFYTKEFSEMDVKAFAETDEDETELLESFEGRTSKMILLQDLTAMAFADGDIMEHEKVFVFDVGGRMGISDESIEDLIALNEEVMDANRRLNDYVFCNEL